MPLKKKISQLTFKPAKFRDFSPQNAPPAQPRHNSPWGAPPDSRPLTSYSTCKLKASSSGLCLLFPLASPFTSTNTNTHTQTHSYIDLLMYIYIYRCMNIYIHIGTDTIGMRCRRRDRGLVRGVCWGRGESGEGEREDRVLGGKERRREAARCSCR